MRLRYKLISVLAVLGAVFVLGRCSRTRLSGPNNAPPVLPANDLEQIHVDPSTHRLIITTPTSTRTLTLPDRQSTIDIHKDGTVGITSPQVGFETHPFVGLGYGQGTRVYLGADLGYWKKADVGLGVASPNLLDNTNQNFNDFRFGLFGSYTVYSNTRLTLGLDNQKAVHFLLSVRI